MSESTALSPIITIVWVLVGILLSLILPVAVKTLTDAKPKLEDTDKPPTLGDRIKAAWEKIGGNKYLVVFFAALLIAVVIVVLLDLKFFVARDAILAGFAWEGFVNKLFTKQSG